ncbi:MAG: BolA family protein [Oceanicaulis sp.]
MQHVKQRLEEKLAAAFAPEALEISDDSALHAGHAGAREGGESHFTVMITADAFAGKSRIERHRLVNAALKEELAGPVHALVIKAKAPGE